MTLRMQATRNRKHPSSLTTMERPHERHMRPTLPWVGGTGTATHINSVDLTMILDSIMAWDTHVLLRYMRYINVILALFQALTGFFGLFDLAMLNVTSFLIAVYVIIFALLLLAFECRFSSMEPTIRQLFGFLFTYRGRTAFIFFVGFMNFGMRDAMAKLAGVLMCTNAFLNLIVMTCHPSFRSGALRADMDPTTGYTAGEDETAQVLKANSHLAAQAGTYAFSHLSPDVATQVYNASSVEYQPHNLPPRRAKAKSSPAYPQQTPSVWTSPGNGSAVVHVETVRRYLLKLTPIEGKDLLPTARYPFCTLVLLDKDLKELKGEKRRTPVGKVHHAASNNPVWSPLKAAVLRSMESSNESNMPLGIGVAAAAEEYTFGTTVNLRKAKYVLVKCKDKGQVQTEDLGRLLLALDDLDTSGMELTSWYDLQMHTGMKRVQGKLRLSCRIIREPSRKQLWLAAEQMRAEISVKDHYLYLKCHPKSFSGRHATEWMLRHGLNRPMKGGITCSTEEEALLLGDYYMMIG
ncbi:hypothetical protein DYB26_001685 [Aphanomyces astaci]|uniref:Uncharacterized protein n=1 Tax=Aphanomyces astaci TaxID=112090 RepID=A0A418FQU1_APHAT|nr:hypothetical protein DYB26_001685 [Aphanomyces astaci]